MSAHGRPFWYLSCALMCLPGLAVAQAERLQHDPFARPLLAQRPPPAAPEAESEWRPELRAIMAAGAESMVNIDGVVLRRGDEFNGYRLVEVHDESAVFVVNNRRVTLSLPGFEALRTPLGRDDRQMPQRGGKSGKLEDK